MARITTSEREGESDWPEGRRPNPDPTILTTQRLLREIELARNSLEQRMDAMDKATVLAADTHHAELANRTALYNEKFNSIQLQFAGGDKAISAALTGAKEAVAKSEAATNKEIDGLKALAAQNAKSTDDKIEEVKNRVAIIDGRQHTIEGLTKGKDDLVARAFGLISILVAIGTLLAVVLRKP